MAQPQAGVLGAIAWVVALVFACALGAVALAVNCYRRSRRAELRLRQLESAVAEFCTAFRSRLALERARQEDEPEQARDPPHR